MRPRIGIDVPPAADDEDPAAPSDPSETVPNDRSDLLPSSIAEEPAAAAGEARPVPPPIPFVELLPPLPELSTLFLDDEDTSPSRKLPPTGELPPLPPPAELEVDVVEVEEVVAGPKVFLNPSMSLLKPRVTIWLTDP